MINILRLGILGTAVSLTAAAHGQVAAAALATAAAPHIVAALPALLTGAVSSGSAHVGQAVLAKVASPSVLSDGTKLPVGSQILGHITQVQSLAKGSGKSSLGMVFDHFKTPGAPAKELATGMLQSIGSGNAARSDSQKQQQTQTTSQTSPSSGNPVGSLLGGVTNAVGATVGAVGNTATGLVGAVTSLPGVLLNSTGTLVSQGRDVQVPAGTQVSISADASVAAGASATAQ